MIDKGIKALGVIKCLATELPGYCSLHEKHDKVFLEG